MERLVTSEVEQDFSRYVDDRTGEGIFRVHLDLFRDPALFDLEMKYIFERSWIFLAHESQLPNPHDFYTTTIGRQPVVIMRDAEGEIGVFINSCRHKGARVCLTERGNKPFHVCPYHGWTYDSSGRNIALKDEREGGYSDAFLQEDHGLAPVPRVGNYRGFVWASLSDEVTSLESFLGETRFFIDCFVDQTEGGLELVPGESRFTYDGNWKLQVENAMDIYHVVTAHTSFMNIASDRMAQAGGDAVKTWNLEALFGVESDLAYYTFPHGHQAFWIENPRPQDRPIYAMRDQLLARLGEQRTRMVLNQKSLILFPNLLMVDSASFQMRVVRPLSVDKTEMLMFCLAPAGEPAEARALRIRQYEDFFSATGIATPDDSRIYELCQEGDAADYLQWNQGYGRGIEYLRSGGERLAKEFGFSPLTATVGPVGIQGETNYHANYREWVIRMNAGQARARETGHVER